MKTKFITFALASFIALLAIPFIFEQSIMIGTIYSIFAVVGSFSVGVKLFGGKHDAN